MTSTGNDSSGSRLRNRLATESQPIEETTRRAQQKHGKTLKRSVTSAPSTTKRATAAEVEKAELEHKTLGMPPVTSSGRVDPLLLRRWGMRLALNLSLSIFGGSWGTTRWLPPRIRRQSESWRQSVALPPGTRRRASRFSHE